VTRTPSRPDARQPNGKYTVECWRRYCRGRGGRARAKHYPGFCKAWATHASRTRANRRRAALGLPLLPLIPCPLIDRPRAVEMRARRSLARRMAAYDGVPYDDRMASSPRVRAAMDQARIDAGPQAPGGAA
jgi:hypothetical protein